jgi:hypothetical protein
VSARPPLWWYFGEPWGAPINAIYERGEVPVGSICMLCRHPIRAGDRGVVTPFVGDMGMWPCPRHLLCYLEEVGWLFARGITQLGRG